MTDIYCGVKNVPKGKKRGTMKQCASKGEVRYYGLKRIDPKLLEHAQSKKGKMGSKKDLEKRMIILRVRLRKTKTKYAEEKNQKKKQEIKKEYEKMAKEFNQISAKLRSMSRSKARRSKK
jgi:hypothetical protein